jgi:predicted DNA-binding transcriptional regulator AlpA
MTNEGTLLTAAQTRNRLGGVSAMFIHRHLTSDPEFPKPIRYAPKGPRFWKSEEIDAYIERKRDTVKNQSTRCSKDNHV